MALQFNGLTGRLTADDIFTIHKNISVGKLQTGHYKHLLKCTTVLQPTFVEHVNI
jgi:hypothetical protein